MAQRPIWRGDLRLALVSCPVALYSARHDRSSIRFNLINPDTGNRIRMMTVDSETNEELQRRNLVKGYEFKKNHYLLLTDEDFEGVKVDSSSTMAIDKFVEAASIDPVYYDTAYYLAPDGAGGRDVYQILREAIGQSGRVALSRLVIGQRERVVAIRPYEQGLAAHTLFEQRDLNDAGALFDEPATLDKEMVKLARQLVDRQTAEYDPADIEDRYETRLRTMIDAKLKGEGVELQEEAEAEPSNVVDLMAALKTSLGEAETAPAAKKAAPAQKSPEPAKAKPTRKRAS
jgi:DNA end-binding protein Ku